ncbi:TlpA family protein disulfide reductase [Chondrinema litorale]|uniref:TlpA family protein disulfide reductase n=1 Tax=Chondrinema litorale TaxID=2994555 RepID=UPI002543B8A1|nr:TlpA disulfide reductase family protein [Chondrinema litorale]UZR93780.1 TlpA disulfide reductase family protein [Chondrinema litorale]
MEIKVKRSYIETAIFLLVIFIIYITGWQTEIAGLLQRGVMLTGLHNASVKTVEQPKKSQLNFSITSLDGEEVNVSALKGKTLFINFWATWCPPCIAEMPEIENLWKDVSSEEIAFLLISTDDEMQKVKDFIDRKEFEFPVYKLNSSVPKELSSSSIPATFIVAPDGSIVYKHSGIANYNTDSFKDFLAKIQKGI